jgi:hypothetical protein
MDGPFFHMSNETYRGQHPGLLAPCMQKQRSQNLVRDISPQNP